MTFLSNAAVLLVAVLHFAFLVLEMFLWDKPFGRKVFGNSSEKAALTKVLAKNQGLYNGFLSAGLIYGVIAGGSIGFQFKVFFLLCVIVAGIYGAFTVSRKIFFVQAVPAILAIILVLISG